MRLTSESERKPERSRYINVEALRWIKVPVSYGEDGGEMFVSLQDVRRAVAAAVATAGVEEIPADVVYCKDCRKRGTPQCSMCINVEGRGEFNWEKDDDFCSWGEARP